MIAIDDEIETVTETETGDGINIEIADRIMI